MGALVQGFGYTGPFIATVGNETRCPAWQQGCSPDGPRDGSAGQQWKTCGPRVGMPHKGVKSDICPAYLSTSLGDSVLDGDKSSFSQDVDGAEQGGEGGVRGMAELQDWEL